MSKQQEPHKRYMVFGHDDYACHGGLGDVCASFNDLDEAKGFCLDKNSYDGFELFDRLTGLEIELP